MSQLSDADHWMIHHARRRGQVLVEIDGRLIEATLISWRHNRRGRHANEARVQFRNGRTLTIKPCSRVTVDRALVEAS